MAYIDIAWLPATENEFELRAAPCPLLYVTPREFPASSTEDN